MFRTQLTTRPSRRALLLGGVALAGVLLTGCAADARLRTPRFSRDEVIDMVRREARDIGVSVPLALAVAHAESYFDPRAESHKGARGVMQVMPATSRSEYGIHPDLLWDPRINIRLGLHFLRRLLKRYRGRVDLALSYYNGGSAVGDLPRARVIPATRKYVRKVRRLRREYRAKLMTGEIGRWRSSRRMNYLSRLARAAN